jgi:hypothetical protein
MVSACDCAQTLMGIHSRLRARRRERASHPLRNQLRFPERNRYRVLQEGFPDQDGASLPLGSLQPSCKNLVFSNDLLAAAS